ncbi:hypothetical protein Bhyg_10816, partial [Pseudolycoriella hygida]
MHDTQIQIHPLILQIIREYYRFGVWQNENAKFYRKVIRIMVFLLGSVGFTTALIGGSLIADNYNESLYLLTAGIIVAVLIFKTILNYSKGDQIYQILGQRFKNLGTVESGRENQYHFLDQLLQLIKSHKQIEGDIDNVKSILSNLFFAQIGTSALCICGSVYAATLNHSASIDQLLINFSLSLYCVFDIFMLAYFGNEIKELRCKLLYCLFECNWTEQTKTS